MKIQRLEGIQEYVLSQGAVMVYFDSYEKSMAGSLLSFRLYNKGVFVSLIAHGYGEEFGQAWRELQCKQ